MKATFSYMVGEDGFGRILEAYERHSGQRKIAAQEVV